MPGYTNASFRYEILVEEIIKVILQNLYKISRWSKIHFESDIDRFILHFRSPWYHVKYLHYSRCQVNCHSCFFSKSKPSLIHPYYSKQRINEMHGKWLYCTCNAECNFKPKYGWVNEGLDLKKTRRSGRCAGNYRR